MQPPKTVSPTAVPVHPTGSSEKQKKGPLNRLTTMLSLGSAPVQPAQTLPFSVSPPMKAKSITQEATELAQQTENGDSVSKDIEELEPPPLIELPIQFRPEPPEPSRQISFVPSASGQEPKQQSRDNVASLGGKTAGQSSSSSSTQVTHRRFSNAEDFLNPFESGLRRRLPYDPTTSRESRGQGSEPGIRIIIGSTYWPGEQTLPPPAQSSTEDATDQVKKRGCSCYEITQAALVILVVMGLFSGIYLSEKEGI